MGFMAIQQLNVLPTMPAADLYAYLQYIREKIATDEADHARETNPIARHAVKSHTEGLVELEESIEAELDRRIRDAKVLKN
jgi:hypothetical protein